MITLHRLSHPEQELLLNSDLIERVEATPDTVVSLTNGGKFIVRETPGEVAERIRDWRGGIVSRALQLHGGDLAGLGEVEHLAASRPEPLAE